MQTVSGLADAGDFDESENSKSVEFEGYEASSFEFVDGYAARMREGINTKKTVLKLLKKYFNKQIRILKGVRSREKVVKVY